MSALGTSKLSYYWKYSAQRFSLRVRAKQKKFHLISRYNLERIGDNAYFSLATSDFKGYRKDGTDNRAKAVLITVTPHTWMTVSPPLQR